jgi:glutamine synthetase
LAAIFTTSNIATDQNQHAMEIMKKIADQATPCLPAPRKALRGNNGSGKHLNWSLATDQGENLLNPGEESVQET